MTFPLIWVGGLVTTYDAGMAVPDWPGTYGYNLLLYPWQTWLAGPWDLFIEHGHRLLGAAAGLLAIALVAVVWLTDRRRWLRAGGARCAGAGHFQGVLGGARVLLDERLVAMIHGCVGPLFFAYLAGLVVVTSRWWQPAAAIAIGRAAATCSRAAWITVGLAYRAACARRGLRHVPLTASPQVFRAALVFHLVVAARCWQCMSLLAAWQAWSRRASGLRGSAAAALVLLLVVQIALGVATYVAKYSWPAWLGDYAVRRRLCRAGKEPRRSR